ncbi:MAG: hypothetical protein KJ850_00995 [Gammaproteobacteria bacterium]|nr:hypothetical protein [Gammaproteobacteria bacterium]MBU1623599.1 hypothetical protein [Gammaproteobacteria bacterium]
MSTLLKATLLAVLFFGLGGCTSVVKLNVKHAPEMDMGPTRTLSVARFTVSGQVNLDVANDRDAWSNLVKNAVVGSFAAPSDVSVQENQYSSLVDALTRNGYYQISTGMADAKLSGHVDYRVDDSLSSQENKKAEEGKRMTYTLTRTVEATLHFLVTDQRGMVLGNSQVKHASEKKWTDDSEKEVRERAQQLSVSSYVMDEISAANALLVKKIAPHYVMESRVLEDCDSEQSKQGNKAAENGDWLAAASHWQAMSSSGDAQCRHAAEYNLGVFDESEGRLGEALMRFENAFAFTRNAKFSADAERIRQRMREEERMKQNEAKRQ